MDDVNFQIHVVQSCASFVERPQINAAAHIQNAQEEEGTREIMSLMTHFKHLWAQENLNLH